jgi:hypothetical protein
MIPVKALALTTDNENTRRGPPLSTSPRAPDRASRRPSSTMFSPEASVQSARGSQRNSRRRPRNSDGPQQPRRKRSKLGDETFMSVADAPTNENGIALTNGNTGNGSIDSRMVLVEMPVREKKETVKRASKDDSAVYLVGLRDLGSFAHG